MECGQTQTLINAIASCLYKDSSGNVYLNVLSAHINCDDLIPLISCDNNHLPADIQLLNAIIDDSCEFKSISLTSISGGDFLGVRKITISDNQIPSDEVIICDSAIAITLTLLPAVGQGKVTHVKNIGVGVVTVEGYLAETIDGDPNQAMNKWDALHLVDYELGKYAIL
jgi:hypothetical protein